jgi:hypothetical protein
MGERRRWAWLGAAAVGFGLAAWLMSRSDDPEEKPQAKRVDFPRYQRTFEYERAERRRTLSAKLPATAAAAEPVKRQVRDPLLLALPPRAENKTALVLEANALSNSPVGALLLDCFNARHNGQKLSPAEKIKQLTHVDVSRDIDRIGLSSDGFSISGNFKDVPWDTMFADGHPEKYGDNATLYDGKGKDADGKPNEYVARWKDELFLLATTKAGLQAQIDRIEGRGPQLPPVVNEQDAYGEMYGMVSPDDVASLLGHEFQGQADQLKSAARSISLHMDTSHDVAMVADVNGDDPKQVSELGRTLGAALSMGRMKAQLDGDKGLAEMLDFANIAPDPSGRFRAELAVPLDVIARRLAKCKDDVGDGGAAELPPAQHGEADPVAPSPEDGE